MSRVRQAYHAHSLLEIAGVRNYDVDEIPGAGEVTFNYPCLFPIFSFTSGFGSPHDFDYGDQTHDPTFFLVIAPADWGGGDVSYITQEALNAVDGYTTALAGNPDLRTDVDDADSATLENRPTVTMTAAPREILGDWWYVVEIKHQWRLHTEE